MEGTANTIRPTTTQIGVFAEITQGIDVTTSVERPQITHGAHFKMCFDGCGVTDGCAGTLFAVGLRTQCRRVIRVLSQLVSLGAVVRCNGVGLSRGGIGMMFLASMLGRCAHTLPTTSLTLNVLLFDPVPGNLVMTTRCYGSCLPILTSTRSMDLRGAVHLRRVLALYPYQPLPDIAFHAPILCRYPSHEGLEVEEDVCMGCHQGSLYMGSSLDWCVG